MGGQSTTKDAGLAVIPVVERILDIRGVTVILDADLAAIYGVETRAINQAVKRNAGRFPEDFAFRLTIEETERLRRSQIVILKRGRNVKYRPWAFTEHGAIMAASLLNSPRAVEMSVYVVRAFVRCGTLREVTLCYPGSSPCSNGASRVMTTPYAFTEQGVAMGGNR
ncbi:MAG: ORF6N domain-containing protein [Chloroflexi bacterium]|nr:ORF6N domain-containing protein [Chloroflexota bacterium]